eukprot:1143473-Pelagomonas_calceolata.AAC.2
MDMHTCCLQSTFLEGPRRKAFHLMGQLYPEAAALAAQLLGFDPAQVVPQLLADVDKCHSASGHCLAVQSTQIQSGGWVKNIMRPSLMDPLSAKPFSPPNPQFAFFISSCKIEDRRGFRGFGKKGGERASSAGLRQPSQAFSSIYSG